MLQKKQRLKTNSAFKATFRLKQSAADALLVLYTGKEKTESQISKIGFIVSKKIHKRAVKRNRIKRLLREACRIAIKENKINPKWVSLIFMAREKSLNANYKEVYNSITTLIKKMETKSKNEENHTKIN